MNYPIYLTTDQVEHLQYEVVSVELRVYLTRLLDRRLMPDGAQDPKVYWQNRLINKSRALLGRGQAVLPTDELAALEPSVQAWHEGEFQLMLRRLDTPRLVEFLADLIYEEYFSIAEINELLEQDGVSFRYREGLDGLSVEVFPIQQLEEEEDDSGHPNIRILVSRMDTSLENEDYPAVLHATASIFETMAKDIIGIDSVEDQSLGSFFDRYRIDSSLPTQVLDYILDIYNQRNTSPLAGHGSTDPPDIDEESAVILSEMTKAFVKIEYWSHQAVGPNADA